MRCIIEQEPDPETGRYRWLIQAHDPCQCAEIGMGGFSTFVPYRPYEVTYYDTFLISSDPKQIQQWLNCTGLLHSFYFSDGPPCSVGGPLGMEDGRIRNESITASSVWGNFTNHAPPRARLNTQGHAAAWVSAGNSDPNPWIQVDFVSMVTITGLITQGRGDQVDTQWVTEYQVTYSDDGQSWNHMTDADGASVKFAGNSDRNTLVTARFSSALHTRILRIHPLEWSTHCSMRFEVIGCYTSQN
ncbi:lactadherin-like [Patiria miniata]|uniref:F5/8 type C domain-containing protein n=1 Tax=Patiria miniata TaxID=46514 RepID=A0A913Z4Q4_PATMI|nr:lactadherin-like [Patiria miniata]